MRWHRSEPKHQKATPHTQYVDVALRRVTLGLLNNDSSNRRTIWLLFWNQVGNLGQLDDPRIRITPSIVQSSGYCTRSRLHSPARARRARRPKTHRRTVLMKLTEGTEEPPGESCKVRRKAVGRSDTSSGTRDRREILESVWITSTEVQLWTEERWPSLRRLRSA